MMDRYFIKKTIFVTILLILTPSLSYSETPIDVEASYSIVSQKRVSRVEYEYTLEVILHNVGSSDYLNVVGTVSSNDLNTGVVAGSSMQFGDVSSGDSIVGSSLLVIKHDRRYPFSYESLAWVFTADDMSKELEIPISLSQEAAYVDEATQIFIAADLSNFSSIDPMTLKVKENNSDELCILYDDGVSGNDQYPSDGVYSCEFTVLESVEKDIVASIIGIDFGQPFVGSEFIISVIRQPEPTEADDIIKTQEEAYSIWESLKQNSNDLQTALQQAADQIKLLPLVVDSGVFSGNIWIEYDNGLRGHLLVGPPNTKGGQIVHTNATPLDFAQTPQIPIGGTKVLIWDPFIHEFPTEGAAIKSLFENSLCPHFEPHEIAHINGANANVASVKTFTDYNTIFISTHGLLTPKGVGLATFSQVDPNTYPNNLLQAWGGRMGIGTHKYDNIEYNYWVILPKFIDNLPRKFDNALVWSSACKSLIDSSMADAFHKKGAKSYFGYDDDVHPDFAEQKSIQMFTGLLSGLLGNNLNNLQASEAYNNIGIKIESDSDPATILPSSKNTAELIYPCIQGAELEVLTANATYGTPTTAKLYDLDPTNENVFLGSGGASCNGERGGPLYSHQVDLGALFYPADTVDGAPVDGFFNRPGCSSFIATKDLGTPDEQIWINASARKVQFSTFGTTDREYQTRYYSGNQSTGQPATCEVGRVVNEFSGFEKVFDALCKITLKYGPPSP